VPISLKKIAAIALASGVILSLATAAAFAAKGQTRATVVVSSGEGVISDVRAGDYVTISGSGYKRNAQLSVCRDGDGCTYPTADEDGRFSEEKRFYSLGTKPVKVYDVTPSWSNTQLKATTNLTVTE